MSTPTLRELAEAVKGWGSLNSAWTAEDQSVATVGYYDKESGERYPLFEIDTGKYDEDQAMPLAQFYAAANPVAVLGLLDDIDKRDARIAELDEFMLAESGAKQDMLDRIAELEGKLAALEGQKPVGRARVNLGTGGGPYIEWSVQPKVGDKFYAAAGAAGATPTAITAPVQQGLMDDTRIRSEACDCTGMEECSGRCCGPIEEVKARLEAAPEPLQKLSPINVQHIPADDTEGGDL